MNEISNRLAKALPIVDLVWTRAQGYPGLLDQVPTYDDVEWREIAIQAGVSDGTYTPSDKTRETVLALLGDRARVWDDPFAGIC